MGHNSSRSCKTLIERQITLNLDIFLGGAIIEQETLGTNTG